MRCPRLPFSRCWRSPCRHNSRPGASVGNSWLHGVGISADSASKAEAQGGPARQLVPAAMAALVSSELRQVYSQEPRPTLMSKCVLLPVCPRDDYAGRHDRYDDSVDDNYHWCKHYHCCSLLDDNLGSQDAGVGLLLDQGRRVSQLSLVSTGSSNRDTVPGAGRCLPTIARVRRPIQCGRRAASLLHGGRSSVHGRGEPGQQDTTNAGDVVRQHRQRLRYICLPGRHADVDRRGYQPAQYSRVASLRRRGTAFYQHWCLCLRDSRRLCR